MLKLPSLNYQSRPKRLQDAGLQCFTQTELIADESNSFVHVSGRWGDVVNVTVPVCRRSSHMIPGCHCVTISVLEYFTTAQQCWVACSNITTYSTGGRPVLREIKMLSLFLGIGALIIPQLHYDSTEPLSQTT